MLDTFKVTTELEFDQTQAAAEEVILLLGGKRTLSVQKRNTGGMTSTLVLEYGNDKVEWVASGVTFGTGDDDQTDDDIPYAYARLTGTFSAGTGTHKAIVCRK